MDIKEQDPIKFWTWCGFEKDKLRKIDGSYHYLKEPLLWLALPLCLDTIFQYAIPKLQEKGYNLHLDSRSSKFFAVIFNSSEKRMGLGISDNPTEALYNAIMKVVNKDV